MEEQAPAWWFVAGVLSSCCIIVGCGAAGALVWLLVVRPWKAKKGD